MDSVAELKLRKATSPAMKQSDTMPPTTRAAVFAPVPVTAGAWYSGRGAFSPCVSMEALQ